MFESRSTSSCDISKYNDMSIGELMKRKKKYINAFDYQQAKIIQNIILEKRGNDISNIIQNCKEEIEKSILEVTEALQERREAVKNRYLEKELEIEEKIDNAFMEVQNKHIEELTGIEQEKAHAITKIMKKGIDEIKESRDLLMQSKRLAQNDDFDAAIMVQNQAKEAQEKYKAAMINQIQEQYKFIKKQTFNKQKGDLKILTGKLTAALHKNNVEKMEELKAQNKLANVTILIQQQKILSVGLSQIISKEKKHELSEVIKKFSEKLISEFNMYLEEQLENDAFSTATSQQSRMSALQSAINEENIIHNNEEEEEDILDQVLDEKFASFNSEPNQENTQTFIDETKIDFNDDDQALGNTSAEEEQVVIESSSLDNINPEKNNENSNECDISNDEFIDQLLRENEDDVSEHNISNHDYTDQNNQENNIDIDIDQNNQDKKEESFNINDSFSSHEYINPTEAEINEE